MKYAGQKKVSRDIDRRLKNAESSKKSEEKRAKNSKINYYAKLLFKNSQNDEK